MEEAYNVRSNVRKIFRSLVNYNFNVNAPRTPIIRYDYSLVDKNVLFKSRNTLGLSFNLAKLSISVL